QISGLFTTTIQQSPPSKEPLNSHVINPLILTNKIEALQNRLFPNDRRKRHQTLRQPSHDRLSIVITNSG
ncbi:unnamed protein product, partial [Rotaria magnacalcarata]